VFVEGHVLKMFVAVEADEAVRMEGVGHGVNHLSADPLLTRCAGRTTADRRCRGRFRRQIARSCRQSGRRG
jgi:hypothetical protein